jgi:hypothetical protein
MAKSLLSTVFAGMIAGVCSAILTVIVAYLVGIVITVVDLGELLPSLLVAVTYLPLMLLLVLLPLSLVISISTGLILAVLSPGHARSRSVFLGAVISLILCLVLLSVIAPMVFHSQPGDFVHIIKTRCLLRRMV